MISTDIKDLWTPTGVILGFQVTLFKWRLEEEARVGERGEIPWLVPADYVNILGMAALLGGAYLLPIAGLIGACGARILVGLGGLLFVGHALGLAAHYQLFNRSAKRQFAFFPVQERVVISLTTLLAVAYVLLAIRGT